MTLHIDKHSSQKDLEKAADIIISLSNSTNLLFKEFVVEHIKTMIFRLSAPFEFRIHSKKSDPILIIHPKTRKDGERAKLEALLLDKWTTEKVEL